MGRCIAIFLLLFSGLVFSQDEINREKTLIKVIESSPLLSSSHSPNCDEPASGTLPSGVKDRVDFYKRAVRETLNPENIQNLASPDGYCVDLAFAWQAILQEKGYPVEVVFTDTNISKGKVKINGVEQRGDKYHAFLVDRSLGEGKEIIIDPSYLQFLDNGGEHFKKRPVFVGTHKDIIALYNENRATIRLDVAGDEHIGQYDPPSLASLNYSFSTNSNARMTLNNTGW